MQRATKLRVNVLVASPKLTRLQGAVCAPEGGSRVEHLVPCNRPLNTLLRIEVAYNLVGKGELKLSWFSHKDDL